MINPYKWLWSRVGGRPWTYIWRDIYRQAEYVIQLLWFSIGVAVGVSFGWKLAFIIWGIYSIGFIFGHLHWGTKYIKGQQGDR